MRVALLVPGFLSGKGGAEKVAAELANLVCRAGGSASVITIPRSGAEPSYPLVPQVDLRGINLTSDPEISAERGRYDAVVGFGMSNFFARIPEIAHLLDVPFAIQECTNPWRMVSTIYIHQQDGCHTLRDAFWLRQAVFSQAAAVRFTVPSYASSVLPVIRPFTYSFYNCFAASSEGRSQPATRKIVCVGAMKSANKNGMAAVHAFATFAERNPDWELHIYGQNKFADELAVVQRKKPHLRILDCGVERDISRIYSDAALLMIPSFDEGLPNVVIEAFYHGVPCIGFSDCPGVNHLIVDGETGLLVDRADPQALVRALERAMDESLRQELSQNAKAFARDHLLRSTFEANWLRLLDNVVAGFDRNGHPRQPAGIARAEPFGRLLSKLLEQPDSDDDLTKAPET